MLSRLHKNLLVEGGWCAGIAATLVVAAAGTLMHLDSQRASAQRLQAEVAGKRARLLEQDLTPPIDLTRLTASERMAASESLRVSALADAARDAGVMLVAMQSREPLPSEDGVLVTLAHDVNVVGGYRQLGRFLGAVNRVAGVAGVAELRIEHNDPEGTDPDELRATLCVSWYAQEGGS